MVDSAKEFLKKEFSEGRCKGITENPTPDFNLEFFDSIAKLMKRYAVYCEIQPITELTEYNFTYKIIEVQSSDESHLVQVLNDLLDIDAELVQIISREKVITREHVPGYSYKLLVKDFKK